MVKKPEVLAIIPARGGSKGIPRKNIRDFAGYPLIAYSIAAGVQARCVTRTIVSTDDEEIAAVARKYGAETPFLRPAEFSQDGTTDLPVFQHALGWLAEHEGYMPDVVIQLRPTTPVRPPDCVDEAVGILLDHPEADSVRGVVDAGQCPYKMWKIDPASGRMAPLLGVEGIKEAFNAPRQKLPQVFWQTGHIDAIRPHSILDKGSMSGDVIMPLVIDVRYTVDIDSPADWEKSEWLVTDSGLAMVDPARARRSFPDKVELLVMDFDGVLTDNRVWVDEQGHEMVAANRSDSLGLSNLRHQSDIQLMVLSREVNPVVARRCEKLKIPYIQSVTDKASALSMLLTDKHINPANVIYMGNDTNDLPAFPVAGYAVAPADAHPEVKRHADMVLSYNGGHGAVRELCDFLLSRIK
ncbi:MAG: acylneuraminate cytidylyltransferase [Anaerolineaceae bacterium]|nr:acylneuraminate cytidylyltransferase [Anaerolineaceae bacterium]